MSVEPSAIGQPEHLRVLQAASGWLDLGDYLAANEELEKLPPELKTHHEVLKLRCRIYRKAKKWKELATIAAGCAITHPNVASFFIDWARAEHEQGNSDKAVQVLEMVKGQFRKSETLAYYLACFLAAQGKIEPAREWLAKAFERAGDPAGMKLRALDQPELRAIWERT